MKKKHKWYETLWWMVKRALRAGVPQIPTGLVAADKLLPSELVPVMVFVGACLTALDKLARDRGWYKGLMNFVL